MQAVVRHMPRLCSNVVSEFVRFLRRKLHELTGDAACTDPEQLQRMLAILAAFEFGTDHVLSCGRGVVACLGRAMRSNPSTP